MTRSDRGPDPKAGSARRSAGEGGSELAAMLKWSALMLFGSLAIAAISIPLLRLFGVD